MRPLMVPGKRDSLVRIGDYVVEAGRLGGLCRRDVYRLHLAVDEIATNIVIHGYGRTGTEGMIEVSTTLDDRMLTVVVEDTARPFNPCLVPEPYDLDFPLESRKIGGLGIYLALQSVDTFAYEYVNRRNRNIFGMYRSGREPDP
ncbi:MAG: ATP-binding protein [Chloroflexaceae bacterium]|nr:ATP-binding protein [Chloroflexaceae bacterium]